MTTAVAPPVAVPLAIARRLGRGLGLILVAALVAGLAAWANREQLGPGLAGMDSDSAMRLVQARDLLAGQGWFDLTQHRLGLGIVEMHWSRLIDGPLAALVLAGDLVSERETAERWALVVWPTLTLGVTFWTCLDLGRRLGGYFGVLVSLLNGSIILLTSRTFFPGRIDHHNVQMVLLILAFWGFVARNNGRGAAVASGLCVSASLLVGTELLPVMAALCGAVASTWALRGADERPSTVAFGAALAGGMTGGFVLLAPRSAWAGGYCDAVAMDLLAPVVGAAVVLATAAATLSQVRRSLRISVLMGAVVLVVAGAVAMFPACLSNPLDRLDPILVQYWLSHVREARGLQEVLSSPHDRYIAEYLLSAAAVPICIYLTSMRNSRSEMGMLFVLCGVTTAFAVYQIRYLSFAVLLSLPAWAALTSHLRQQSLEKGGALLSLASIVALLLSASQGLLLARTLVWPNVLVGSAASAGDAPAQETDFHLAACLLPSNFDLLASLPYGQVASTSNMGAFVLQHTPHRAISAPYHRNQAGMLAQIGVALAPSPQEAARLLRQVGVNYLVLCALDPELAISGTSTRGPPLLLQVARGELEIPGYPPLLRQGNIQVFGAPPGPR